MKWRRGLPALLLLVWLVVVLPSAVVQAQEEPAETIVTTGIVTTAWRPDRLDQWLGWHLAQGFSHIFVVGPRCCLCA